MKTELEICGSRLGRIWFINVEARELLVAWCSPSDDELFETVNGRLVEQLASQGFWGMRTIRMPLLD